MKVIFRPFLLFIILLFIPCAVRAEIYTTPNGYKFEVSLILEKGEIMLGEPIYMDFKVKNLSEIDLMMAEGGDYRNYLGRPESFKINVVGENGETVQKPEIKNTRGGGIWFPKIPLNGEHTIRLYLPHWATFGKTGDYTISCERATAIDKYDGEDRSFFSSFLKNREGGVIVKTTAKIKVVAADHQKVGEIIDNLGKKTIAGDQTAKRLLPFVNDRRIIKYVAEAVKKDIRLMGSLAKFDDDAALEIILSRKDDAENEVRRNVSVALSLSVHPKATGYLLAMRYDKFYPIRLDVVHFLGRTKTDESTKILKEMALDENEYVKGEARRYLQERGEKLN